MLASTAWYGYEVSPDMASEVAANVSRADLVEYAGEVQKIVISWIDALSETELDTVPDLERNYRSNGMYLSSPRLEGWIKEDAGTPIWQFVAGPCVGHVRVHMGEVTALLQVLRSRIRPESAHMTDSHLEAKVSKRRAPAKRGHDRSVRANPGGEPGLER